MKNINEEPAFPNSIQRGLSKREYFTGIAMQSLASWMLNPSEDELNKHAKLCVKFAEKIIKELET